MELKVMEVAYYGDDIIKIVLESEELKGVDIDGKVAILSVDGKHKRPYSIGLRISAYKILFFIKKVGVTSGQLYDLKVGDSVQCQLIYSSTFGKNLMAPEAKICCIGGGVGVSPLINLLKANKNPNSLLLSSFRKEEEAIIESQYTYDIQAPFQTFVTREQSQKYFSGRIEAQHLDFSDKNFDAFYICGTKEFCSSIVENLKAQEIPQDKIFVESW
ncbi:MAG: hypothetical protein ACRCTS_00925 [Fusobacteriaceae bacterium]